MINFLKIMKPLRQQKPPRLTLLVQDRLTKEEYLRYLQYLTRYNICK